MSGICGWIGSSAWAGDPEAGIVTQAATLDSSAGHPRARIAGYGPTYALAAIGAHADTARAGTVLAAIDGEPYFLDAGLRERATKQGPAAVCIELWRLGEESLFAKLAGSFSLAVLDTASASCLLAVDRVGIRPLAFARLHGGGLVFASTVTAVAAHLGTDRQIDPQALLDYTYLHVVPSPRSIFQGVEKLRPASLLKWGTTRAEARSYWVPEFVDGERSESELAHAFRAALRSGVQHALRPAVPTATFLSGGIDSSTVTGLLAELSGRGRPAYTVGFAESGYDETEFARIAADHFGADLRLHYITHDEVSGAMSELAALFDEPFGNSSAVPALICAQRARADGIEHLLAGDGGDELFAGNVRYARQHVLDIYSRLPSAARALVAAMPVSKVRSYVTQASMPMPDRMESYNFLIREGLAQVFEPDFANQVDVEAPLQLMRERYREARASSMLDRMLYLDWKFTLADNDLRKVSATCQHAGVAVSFPWLAHELLELSTRVPAHLKMRGTKLRYFAKRSLSGFLPAPTIAKKKHGFGLPFGEWLKKYPPLQGQVYGLLAQLKSRGIYRRDFIDRLIEQHRGGHASYYGTMVWVLAMLEAWIRAHERARTRKASTESTSATAAGTRTPS